METQKFREKVAENIGVRWTNDQYLPSNAEISQAKILGRTSYYLRRQPNWARRRLHLEGTTDEIIVVLFHVLLQSNKRSNLIFMT